VLKPESRSLAWQATPLCLSKKEVFMPHPPNANAASTEALVSQIIAAGTLPSFAEVVENVRTSHVEGLDQLYMVFCGLAGSLRKQFGSEDFDDRLHDIFIVVAEAIRDGKLREPGALSSYIHAVGRFSLWSKIGVRTLHARLADGLRYWEKLRGDSITPEDLFADVERTALMAKMLETLPKRECEILTRFYLQEQTREDICREMHLTDTQFRLAKSRAKKHLVEASCKGGVSRKHPSTRTPRPSHRGVHCGNGQ
jgi:RNA polymerase sigma-70 factor (ECF subfamily)